MTSRRTTLLLGGLLALGVAIIVAFVAVAAPAFAPPSFASVAAPVGSKGAQDVPQLKESAVEQRLLRPAVSPSEDVDVNDSDAPQPSEAAHSDNAAREQEKGQPDEQPAAEPTRVGIGELLQQLERGEWSVGTLLLEHVPSIPAVGDGTLVEHSQQVQHGERVARWDLLNNLGATPELLNDARAQALKHLEKADRFMVAGSLWIAEIELSHARFTLHAWKCKRHLINDLYVYAEHLEGQVALLRDADGPGNQLDLLEDALGHDQQE